jgi:NADH-quinone oxidoreductase subunit H
MAFANPFAFGAFISYFIASLASCKRAPFDLPEAESELVAGFHTEYSGFRWSLFFFAEYAAMFVVCGLATILFLGGWNSPLPASVADSITSAMGSSGIGALIARGVNGLVVNGPFFLMRSSCMFKYGWTLPRIRIDQYSTPAYRFYCR